MRRVAVIVLVSATLLALGSAQAQTPPGTIPAGTDRFPSTGRVTVTIDRLSLTETIELSSEGLPDAVVQRGPLDTKTMTISTEIVSMQLRGKSPTVGEVDVQVGRGHDLPPTVGKVTNVKLDEKGNFKSGDSFFDVFFAISVIRYDLHARNEQPARLQTEIFSFPPNKPLPQLPLPTRLEHFKCYQVKVKAGFSPKTVSLDDQFEAEKAKVVKPVTLCAPVKKDRKKLADSVTHLKCYAIHDLNRKQKPEGRTVLVDNQFGSETLTVGQPRTLCVPSRKSVVVKPKPPARPRPLLADHFKCYDVTPKKPFEPRTVRLEDQFEEEQAKVLRPLSLCAPVKKNGKSLRDPDTHLACYAIEDVSRKPKPQGRVVLVENQFGKEIVQVLKPQALCVPSRKSVLAPCSEYAERIAVQLIAQGVPIGRLSEGIHKPYGGARRSPCP